MTKKHLIFLALVSCFSIKSISGTAQIITPIGGNGIRGYSGDGGSATSASLNLPSDVAIDASMNIYIADRDNHRIRKIDATGKMSTYAGNGTAGYSGDGGTATSAKLNIPTGIGLDAAGNLYIADSYNNAVRKVSKSGIITTIAGNGTAGFSGDGAMATAAQLNAPQDVAVDASGNIYITDWFNRRIRKVNSSGIITTILGDGSYSITGDGGPATSATSEGPGSICIDKLGNIYFNEFSPSSVIRKISSTGIVNMFAGGGTGPDGGAAIGANIIQPRGVAVDNSLNVYISEETNDKIRKVNSIGTISTVCGTISGSGGDGGLAIYAAINDPMGMAIDKDGNLLFADQSNQRIRRIGFNTSSIIDKAQEKDNSLTFYPSPCKEKLTLKLSNNKLSNNPYIIFDIKGSIVFKGTINSDVELIDVTSLANGSYFIKLSQDNKAYMFVKE